MKPQNIHRDLPMVNEKMSTRELLDRLARPILPGRGSGLVFVTSELHELLGVITDADVRRYLQRNNQLPEKVTDLMRSNVISLESQDWEAKAFFKLAQKFDERGWTSFLPVRFLPITENGKLQNVVDLEFYRNELSDLRSIDIVIGLGYVGLTLALKLASHKRRVIGVEANPKILQNLKNGISHIQEPGIENLLENLLGVNFNLISDFQSLKRPEGVIFNFFICVGTPRTENIDSLNLDFTWKAVRAAAKIIQPGDAIIQRSTVPVGTGITICNVLREEYGFEAGQEFHYVAAPERTIEGDALNELHSLPQLLAGATSSCYSRGEHIFRRFVRTIVPFSSLEACELAKIATNAYRDYTFAFANYLASICRPLKIDVNELIAGANFGYERASIPDPSPGVGGPCLSKDSYLMNYVPSQFEFRESPVVVARKFNETVPLEVSNFLSKKIPDLKSKEVLIIGMAFKGKPEVKDLRNSTSVDIAILINGICRKLYVIDAVADLGSINFAQPVKYPNNPSDQISVFMILNNHQQNPQILDYYLSKVKVKHLWVFDPWRLVDTNSLNVEKGMIVTFINLSSTSDLSIGGGNE